MRKELSPARQRACDFARKEPEITTALGTVIVMGIEKLADHQRFTGDLETKYETELCMPSGERYGLVLRKLD